MAAKRTSNKTHDPNRFVAKTKPGADTSSVIARTVLRPTVQAAATLREYDSSRNDLDLSALVHALTEQVEATTGGDTKSAEAMLTAQAHTLDAIFNSLARRAALNMGEYMGACDTYMKLALRAQAQCRATWEALAAVKNPPMVGYVKQANISHGPQQINNNSPSTYRSQRSGENEIQQNELLEIKIGERVDAGTAGTTGGADPAMETVGALNRTEDRCR
jgi:hypothetical protein